MGMASACRKWLIKLEVIDFVKAHLAHFSMQVDLDELVEISTIFANAVDAKSRGYPTREVNLPIESRILAVADIFQALAQNRPYRQGLSVDEILQILQQMAAQRKLDSSVVDCLSSCKQQAYDVALLKAQ